MSAPPRGSGPPTPEDLGRRSLTELRDMWRRQERLLRNEKFICRLPDRGKKIADTAARLQAAIAAREESRRSELFHSVSVDCKFRPSAAEVAVDTGTGQGPEQTLGASPHVPGCSVDVEPSTATSDTHKDSDKPPETDCPENPPPAGAQTPSSAAVTACVPQRPVLAPAAGFSSSTDRLLAAQLQGIEIVDKDEHHTGERDRARAEPPRKPHYMAVLELRASHPVPAGHRFKTNVLPTQPSGSFSPRGRRVSPACPEERRRQEKQHLEDVMAARLLPLHHLPAQLLPMEESLALQQQQRQQYEEMQAKLAAQKLAERLNIHMESYNPEGEAAGRYREVRDEDDEPSSEEF